MRVSRRDGACSYRRRVSDIAIVYVILGAAVVLFVSNLVAVELVAIGVSLSLLATGILATDEALAGFGDPTVIFIASLFVVSEGLDGTGVTTWAGQRLMASVGASRTRLIVMMMLLVAVLTALISVNGAVAALIPVVVIMAMRLGHAPSQLLMPLAFGAHAGSMLALTGTPVNIIVSEAAFDAGGEGFGFFSFTIVGVPLLVGVVSIVVLLGNRLLPNRTSKSLPPDLSRFATSISEHYDLALDVVRLAVADDSPLIGVGRGAIDLSGHPGLELVTVQGADQDAETAVEGAVELPIVVGDVVVVRGEREAVERWAADAGLESGPGPAVPAGLALNRDYGLAEIVVAPRSNLAGTSMTPGMLTPSGQLVVLAIQRNGYDLGRGSTVLAIGDSLIVQGTWEALEDNTAGRDVLLVDAPDMIRRQSVPFGKRAPQAVAVMSVMVVLLATGVVSAAIAGLIAASAMVLLRVVGVEQAYRSISWTTVILVGGMIPLSSAMRETGAAEQLAEGLVSVVGDGSPYLLLAGLFVLTAVLGQLISNTATALVVVPIAVSAAIETGVSERPLLMGVGVAAAASFLTPVATPANLMVMGPGAYKFSDYWRLGLVLMLWFFVIVMAVVPLVWRF
jgi:di/tricarboxylate transporter